MNEDCFINEDCQRPKLVGKKHDPLLDVPERPYLDLPTQQPSSTSTTTTTTTNAPYDPDLLDLIVIPVSGKACPIVNLGPTTTTTTTTTINPLYILGGLKGKFNRASDSSSTIGEGNVGIDIPISDGVIL
jgi:hypothetical protein